MPKKQDQQMFWIPRINVKDIFGEVNISELTGKRMATKLCELPKNKKISTELQNCHNAEVLEADANVSGTEEQECTEQIENVTRGKCREEMEKHLDNDRQEEMKEQDEQEYSE